MDYRVTELLETKSFEALSEDEKFLVKSHLTEDEYQRQHRLIAQFKDNLNDESESLSANDQIRVNALEALRLKNQENATKTVPLWLNYKIPLWTAFAALLLIFILTTPLLFNSEIGESKSNEQLVMRDTVYIEKIVNDTIEIKTPADTVIKTIYTSNKNSRDEIKDLNTPVFSNNAKTMKEAEENFMTSSEEMISPFKFNNRSKGKSLSEDPLGRVLLNISE